MAFMRGKFYVWGDGKNITICHGRDMLPREQQTPEEREMDDFMAAAIAKQGGMDGKAWAHVPDPEELRTGITEPESVWLPEEVFYALAVRAVDRLTPEEIKEYRKPTRWEKWEGRDR